MKRIISIILVAVLLALAIPASTLAANAVCRVDGKEYSTFSEALTAANAATKDVTIELLSDVSIKEVTLQNANGKRITLDGKGYKITTSGGNNAIMIRSDATFKDFTVVHKNEGSAFQIYTCSDVILDGVIVDATAEVKRNYTLINTLGTGGKTVLTVKNSKIYLAANAEKSGTTLSAIRTGNGGGDVEINVFDSYMDVSRVKGASAIQVIPKTEAHLTLKDTEMLVYACAVITENQPTELYNCKWNSIAPDYYPNDSSLIRGNMNLYISEYGGTQIHSVQSTDVKNGKFDIRFVTALKTDELESCDRLIVKITAAYGKTVYFTKEYNVQTVYEALQYKDADGNSAELKKEGCYLGYSVVNGFDVMENEAYFTARLYAEKNKERTPIDVESFTFKNGEYVEDKLNSVDYSLDRASLTGRYLLVSDVHFTTLEQNGYVNRVTYRGYTNKQRMEMLCEEIKTEYYRRGLDAVLVLGDLSTDDYPIRHEGTNFCRLFYKYYMKPLSEELGIPVLVIPGNHDSYPNEMWLEVAGTDRQFVWENPNNGDVFLMLDTYDTSNGQVATGGSGNPWTGVNVEWAEAQLIKYKDRDNVFITGHWLGRSEEQTAVLEYLIEKYPNVRAMFDAHSHTYGVYQLQSGRYIINDGAYSYDCVYDDVLKKYNFDNIRTDNLWSFHILEVTDDAVRSYQINTEHTYVCDPGSVNTEYYLESYYTPYVKFEEIKHK